MSSKRRASADMATPASKKRRQTDDSHWPGGVETAEGTSTAGLKLLDSLKRSQDKTGRPVATHFLQLPPRTNAAYYKRIKLPLSFQEIQAKLEARQYGNMTALESDLKRMVQNAKEFNVTGSKIYEDAERIRKALSNYMPRHNPAYKDKDYRAAPTPLPDDDGEEPEENTSVPAPKPEPEPAPPPKTEAEPPSTSTKSRANGTSRRRSRSGAMDQAEAVPDNAIREDQLKIVEEMMELRDPGDADTEITLEFYQKPPRRAYPDYYRQISHPTALKDIQKAVSSDKYPTWESFVTEVEFLWENARTYNEEGSFIHENANKLRDWFWSRMSGIEGARDVMAPKKLKLNPPKNPVPQPTTRIKLTNPNKDIAQAGIAVDEEARRRQNEHVRAGSRGQINKSTESPVPLAARPAASKETTKARSATPARSADPPKADASVAPTETGNKAEDPASDPKTEDGSAKVDDHLPSTGRGVSRQRTPSTAPMQPRGSGSQQPPSGQVTHSPVSRPAYQASSAFDRVLRDPGKGLADALFRGIRASTHPGLHHAHPWAMAFYPSASQTQHGKIVHLPSSHWCLRITAWLSEECLRREHFRTVVSRNLVVVEAERSADNGSLSYQVKLHPGPNVIAVDFLATINKKGQPAPVWPEERHDFERFVLTVNFVKHA